MARINRAYVTVTHYVVCSDKNNEAYGERGLYKETSGICWNVDSDITHTILIDKERISFENIYRIDSSESLFELKYPSENTWFD